MLNKISKYTLALTIGMLCLVGQAQRVVAQSYPIDCAILLCLSGGWPSSAPCTRARAEFIRRITPWPVEPPLQIWRCPMGASYEQDQPMMSLPRLYEAIFQEAEAGFNPLGDSPELHFVQERADIDISGAEFNFVRSIRVFDVRYARQHESGRDGDCNRSAIVRLGTYGTQGEFSWHRSTTASLPSAHVGLERWGQNCPSIYHRSVFVDWRDYEGNYGFEQINY